MLKNGRIRVFLALYGLVAFDAAILTYLPQPVIANHHEPKPRAAKSTPPKLDPIPTIPHPRAELVPPKRQSSASTRLPEPAPIMTTDLSGLPTIMHTLKPGESLGSISHRYLPHTMFMMSGELEAAIRQANPELRGAHVHPGQTIIIPGIEPTPIVEHPVPLAKDAEVRAIYLTGWTAGSARGLELIRRWKAAGGNAICFDVKDMDGLVNVPFDHPLAPRGRRPLIRNLPKFARYVHKLGLHVIARIALFRDEHIAKQHPEFSVQSRRGKAPWRENGKQVWADPSRREVQDYNIALARHVAGSGVDEIQFDYVRFPAEGEQQDAQFFFETEPVGGTRAEVITGFLKRAYGELRPLGVLVSLDVFGVMAWQRPVDLAHTGQNIAEMARSCDVLSPMIYPSHFFGMDGFDRPGDAPEHFIGASMERFRQVTAGTGVILRPWLQAFGWRTKTYSPDYVLIQVNVAKQKGGIGYLFWNANNDYSKPFVAMPTLMKAARRHDAEKSGEKEQAAAAGPDLAALPPDLATRKTQPYPPTGQTSASEVSADF